MVRCTCLLCRACALAVARGLFLSVKFEGNGRRGGGFTLPLLGCVFDG